MYVLVVTTVRRDLSIFLEHQPAALVRQALLVLPGLVSHNGVPLARTPRSLSA